MIKDEATFLVNVGILLSCYMNIIIKLHMSAIVGNLLIVNANGTTGGIDVTPPCCFMSCHDIQINLAFLFLSYALAAPYPYWERKPETEARDIALANLSLVLVIGHWAMTLLPYCNTCYILGRHPSRLTPFPDP